MTTHYKHHGRINRHRARNQLTSRPSRATSLSNGSTNWYFHYTHGISTTLTRNPVASSDLSTSVKFPSKRGAPRRVKIKKRVSVMYPVHYVHTYIHTLRTWQLPVPRPDHADHGRPLPPVPSGATGRGITYMTACFSSCLGIYSHRDESILQAKTTAIGKGVVRALNLLWQSPSRFRA